MKFKQRCVCGLEVELEGKDIIRYSKKELRDFNKSNEYIRTAKVPKRIFGIKIGEEPLSRWTKEFFRLDTIGKWKCPCGAVNHIKTERDL